MVFVSKSRQGVVRGYARERKMRRRRTLVRKKRLPPPPPPLAAAAGAPVREAHMRWNLITRENSAALPRFRFWISPPPPLRPPALRFCFHVRTLARSSLCAQVDEDEGRFMGKSAAATEIDHYARFPSARKQDSRRQNDVFWRRKRREV